MCFFYSVKLKKPFNGKSDFFFGSLSAIYETLTSEQLGVGLGRLYNIGVSRGEKYDGRLCCITQNTLIRKKTKRGKQFVFLRLGAVRAIPPNPKY